MDQLDYERHLSLAKAAWNRSDIIDSKLNFLHDHYADLLKRMKADSSLFGEILITGIRIKLEEINNMIERRKRT